MGIADIYAIYVNQNKGYNMSEELFFDEFDEIKDNTDNNDLAGGETLNDGAELFDAGLKEKAESSGVKSNELINPAGATGLVLSGAVDVQTGYTLIKHRAACMDKAAKKNGGKMAAGIGLDASVIEEACKEIADGGDYVVPVNYNTPVQTVIAGSEAGVAKAAELLKAKGAKRTVPLAVAAAFHSEYMKEAGLEFKELIKDIKIGMPQKAFYSNVTGGKLTDFSEIHDLMSRHIFSSVRFTSELAAMRAGGIDRFVECGPGKALTGMVKKTLENVEAIAVDE